jgi:malonyl-CoA O-methyltransferase
VKEQVPQSMVIKEFSRFAHSYDSYNEIQKKVAKCLVESISTVKYKKIIDIGCGSGSLYRYLQKKEKLVKEFIALDSSKDMLSLHPNNSYIKKVCTDFDSEDAFCHIVPSSKTLILSSSALQWSKDLDSLFNRISKLSKDASFAIFTDNTFKTLHKTALLDSPIYSTETLQKYIDKYYSASYTLKTYQLEFTSVKEMFRYIKKSGVSGGKKQLGYKEMKLLMESYPLDYLEFEVLFVQATSLKYEVM